MNKHSLTIRGIALLGLFVCSPRLVLAQNADARLDTFFKEYLEEHFHRQPIEATQLGDHRFDHLLDDVSPKARDGWLAHARQTLKELPKRVDYAKLSRAGQIDFEI